MSNVAWLCDYDNSAITNTYFMVIQTTEFDGVQRYWLEQKKPQGIVLDEKEKQVLDTICQKSIKFTNTWNNGEFINELPHKIFKTPNSKLPNANEPFFKIINGYLIVSKKFYEIIFQFNLGKTHFSQVYIYDIETGEQLSDIPYYFINIAETFNFLKSNESKGIKASNYSPNEPLRYIWDMKDDDIQLMTDAENCSIDLWHEQYLNNSLFFSDRLVECLLASGFTTKQLGLIRCIIQ